MPEKVEIKKSGLIIETINDFSKNIQTDVMIVPDSIYINSDKLKRSINTNEENDINYLYSSLKYSNNINVIDTLKNHNKKTNMYYNRKINMLCTSYRNGYKSYI
mgnify:CR=1 FL=1